MLERKIEIKLTLSRFPNETVIDESNLALDLADLQLEDKETKAFNQYFSRII